jgi:FkbM family methyltransferase
MLNALLYSIFLWLSRTLRRTPIRRIRWLGDLHNRVFGSFNTLTVVDLGDHVLHVDPRDRVLGKKLALYGEYEQYTQELLLSLAAPGSVVVDVGANIGLHTIPLARRVGPKGTVIAFEPDPDNFQILCRNIRVNSVSNVCTYKLALSSGSGAALLYQSWENRGGLSLCKRNVESRGPQMRPVSIETVAGDDLLLNTDKPISLVKIDVEGAEPLVLWGMEKTLLHNPSVKILFEFWPHYVRNLNVDPFGFLSQLERDGFCLKIVDSTGRRLIQASAEELVHRGEFSDRVLNVLAARRTMDAI